MIGSGLDFQTTRYTNNLENSSQAKVLTQGQYFFNGNPVKKESLDVVKDIIRLAILRFPNQKEETIEKFKLIVKSMQTSINFDKNYHFNQDKKSDIYTYLRNVLADHEIELVGNNLESLCRFIDPGIMEEMARDVSKYFVTSYSGTVQALMRYLNDGYKSDLNIFKFAVNTKTSPDILYNDNFKRIIKILGKFGGIHSLKLFITGMYLDGCLEKNKANLIKTLKDNYGGGLQDILIEKTSIFTNKTYLCLKKEYSEDILNYIVGAAESDKNITVRLKQLFNDCILEEPLNFSGCDFSGMNLEMVDFRGINLENANFSNANLSSADLSGLDLRKVVLYKANLSYATLKGSNLEKQDLRNIKLFYANFYKANLQEANLSKCDLTFTNLSHAYLRNANLYKADFWGEFRNPKLTNYRQHNQKFEKKSLYYFEFDIQNTLLSKDDTDKLDWYKNRDSCEDYDNWSNDDYINAYLRLTDDNRYDGYYDLNVWNQDQWGSYTLKKHKVKSAYLSLIYSIYENKSDELSLDNEKKAKRWSESQRFGTLFKANLSGANLQYASLQGKSLKEANLQNANLENACLWYTNLNNANLQGSNISNADLLGVSLFQANLKYVIWNETKFDNVVLLKSDIHQKYIEEVMEKYSLLLNATSDGQSMLALFPRQVIKDTILSRYKEVVSYEMVIEIEQIIKYLEDRGVQFKI